MSNKRKEIYTIRVLDDKEFDNLPYKGINDSLGFADPETGDAFVRRTGVKEMDMATIQHEMEELISSESFHEDANGIRHKKGKDIFRKVVAPIAVGVLTGGLGLPAWAGATAGAIGGGIDAYQDNKSIGNVLKGGLTGGLGALTGTGAASGWKAAGEAGKGVLGKTTGAIKGALGMPVSGSTTGTQTVGSTGLTSSQLASPEIQGYIQTAGKTSPYGIYGNPSVKGTGLTASSGLSASTLPANVLGSAAGSVLGQSLSPVTQIGKKTTEEATKKTLMESAKELITPQSVLGAVTSLGSMAPQQPTFEMPSTVGDIRAKLMSGEALSPLGMQARSELSNILSSTPTELYPTATDEYYNAALRRTRESYAEAEKQLDAAYNLAGVYGSGEHLAQKAKLKEELARTESALAAETEQRRFELARTAQYQAIQDSLGVDREVMDDLVGLTGLDVQTAAMIYGAQVADVQAIREALGSLGSELLIRGTTKTPTNTGIIVN